MNSLCQKPVNIFSLLVYLQIRFLTITHIYSKVYVVETHIHKLIFVYSNLNLRRLSFAIKSQINFMPTTNFSEYDVKYIYIRII